MFTEAVAQDRAYSLPEPTRDVVESILHLARKRKTAIELADAPRQDPLCVLDPLSDLKLKVPVVTGETDIYGVVNRVGGSNPKFASLSMRGIAFRVPLLPNSPGSWVPGSIIEWV